MQCCCEVCDYVKCVCVWLHMCMCGHAQAEKLQGNKKVRPTSSQLNCLTTICLFLKKHVKSFVQLHLGDTTPQSSGSNLFYRQNCPSLATPMLGLLQGRNIPIWPFPKPFMAFSKAFHGLFQSQASYTQHTLSQMLSVI